MLTHTILLFFLDAPRGFEPRLRDSESSVRPLDEGAIIYTFGGSDGNFAQPTKYRGAVSAAVALC